MEQRRCEHSKFLLLRQTRTCQERMLEDNQGIEIKEQQEQR